MEVKNVRNAFKINNDHNTVLTKRLQENSETMSAVCQLPLLDGLSRNYCLVRNTLPTNKSDIFYSTHTVTFTAQDPWTHFLAGSL